MKKYPQNMANIILRALEYTTDGIIIGSLDGTVYYHNKAWLRIHALDENLDLRGKKIRDYERPELLPILNKLNERLMRDGSYTYQFGTVRRDGIYHDVYLAANIIREFNPPVAVVILKEVTDLVQTQKEVARRNMEIELFNEIYTTIARAQSKKRVISHILKLLGDYVGAKAAGFYMIDHAKKEAVLIDSRGLPPRVRERVMHIPIKARAFGRIAKSRHTFVMEEDMPGHDGGVPDIRKTMGIKRTIGTVFRTGTNRDYLAIFGLPEAESVDPEIRNFFDAAAKRFGIAIERVELLDTLEKRENELEKLTARLIDTAEEQNRHCARMLHDEFGQALTALKLELEMFEKKMGPLNSRARESLEAMRKHLRFVAESARSLSKSLHPAMLDELGLVPTLNWYIDNFVRSKDLEVVIEEAGFDENLPLSASLALYRVAQEALMNVLRHSWATKVTISLTKGYPHAIMEIEDNGQGILRKKGKNEAKGLGLVTMRERVEYLGGTFQVTSSPGKGTRIRVKIPIEALDV
jgi:PAS domain S-box-containing protein